MKVTAQAPINIALIKYWGKKDDVQMTPYNDSLSVTLDTFHTTTTLMPHPDHIFELRINHQTATEAETLKAYAFLTQFESFLKQPAILIDSHNTVYKAAGLASSASAFAALAKAADQYYQTNHDLQTLAAITRQGSGSACRSLLGGLVRWQQDGLIKNIEANTDQWVMVFVLIDTSEKTISSRQAMKHTVETSSLYDTWVHSATHHLDDALKHLKQNNFFAFGQTIENNALLMHEVMRAANPPVDYFTDQTKRVLHLVKQLRTIDDVPVFASVDAGPNVKILTKQAHVNTLIKKCRSMGLTTVVTNITKQGAKTL